MCVHLLLPTSDWAFATQWGIPHLSRGVIRYYLFLTHFWSSYSCFSCFDLAPFCSFFFPVSITFIFVSFFPIHFCFSSQSYPVTLFPLLFIVSCSHAFLLPGYLFILSLFHLFSHYHEHNTWVNTESTTLDASLPAPKMSLVW